MIRRILVPLDGSKLAEQVLPTVEGLAGQLHAEIVLVNVVDVGPEIPPSDEEPADLVRDLREREVTAVEAAERYLAGVATELKTKKVDVKWEAIEGVAATSIVNYAHSHEVDLIAMSTHGRSGLDRLISGSVADEVVREAGIPVLLVRPSHKST